MGKNQGLVVLCEPWGVQPLLFHFCNVTCHVRTPARTVGATGQTGYRQEVECRVESEESERCNSVFVRILEVFVI